MKIKHKDLIALLAICAGVLFMTGCTSPADKAAWQLNQQAEASGSLYRYRVKHISTGFFVDQYRAIPPAPVSTPANLQPTAIQQLLQKDILEKIALMQKGWNNKTTPLLLGVKPIGAVGSSIKETWFVKDGMGADRYNITASPNSKGGSDFQIEGPLN